MSKRRGGGKKKIVIVTKNRFYSKPIIEALKEAGGFGCGFSSKRSSSASPSEYFLKGLRLNKKR